MAINHYPAKLAAQIDALTEQAKQFDELVKNTPSRFHAERAALFADSLFQTRSPVLLDYVNEIKEGLAQLAHSHGEFANRRSSQILGQVEAVLKLLQARTVWQKQAGANQQRQANRKTKPDPYRQAAANLLKPAQHWYQELSTHQDYERRLLDNVLLCQQQLQKASATEQAKLTQQLLMAQARLGRCRKAIAAIEEEIQRSERNN